MQIPALLQSKTKIRKEYKMKPELTQAEVQSLICHNARYLTSLNDTCSVVRAAAKVAWSKCDPANKDDELVKFYFDGLNALRDYQRFLTAESLKMSKIQGKLKALRSKG